MEEYLLHEFAKQPPSLFDKGIMRKNTKSVLASVLKSKVNVHLELPDNARFVLDGGHLLQSLPWPADPTYNQVCDQYVSHVLVHYGPGSIVVFDGYGSASSTKTAEQQRRAEQNTSPDIVFELEMKPTTSKKAFLGNGRNKDRLIQKLKEKFEAVGIIVKQSVADADWLIASTAMITSTAIDGAPTQNSSVVVVGTDTDLLVMMVAQATPNMNLHMLCGRNPLHVYCIREIQEACSSIKQHLMFVHAITGCDTVSAIYNQGKKRALQLFDSDDNWDCLSVFSQSDSIQDEIARVGELFLLKLYGAVRSKSLDKHRYVMYFRSTRRASLFSSGFKLESIPPTSAAAKFHSYRTYHAVQQWQGNELPPNEWGWEYREGILVPIYTDRPVAPEKVLKMVSCGCKVGCGKSCGCYKAGMECTIMCTGCNGYNCKNSHVLDVQGEGDTTD